MLLLCTVLLLALIIGDDRLFFNQIILGVVLILQVAELIRFVNYTNRELAKFIIAIKHSDFSINFKNSKIGKSFHELHVAFDDIIQTYETTKIEKEAQFHYLKMVVENINIGIISIENDENIILMNDTANRLLGVKGIQNWRILGEKLPHFISEILSIGNSGRKLIDLNTSTENLTLSVDVNTMKLLNKQYKLITFQDIKGEIEQKEIEAWHKLIRILTHEIMNSATPISSLTETMQSMLIKENKAKKAADLSDENIEDLLFSLKTINRRSNGMLSFIEDYRKLTKVAQPKMNAVEVLPLLQNIYNLLSPELSNEKIELTIDVYDVDSIIMDATLIEQVLINLIKNSRHALQGKSDAHINIKVYSDNNKAVIEVTDNGKGINDKELKEIFVPFFSTKKEGSGIGLSLSKQIMHLHGGQIKVKSKLGEGTSFYLIFISK